MKRLIVLFLCWTLASCINEPIKPISPFSQPDQLASSNNLFIHIQDVTPKIVHGGQLGSGIVISQDNRFSYILTDRHVVDTAFDLPKNVDAYPTTRPDPSNVWVTDSGDVIDCEVVVVSGLDYDLALLRSTHHFRGVVKFSSELPAIGTQVYIIGYPKGLPLMVTHGIVSRYDVKWKPNCIFINSDSLTVVGMSGGGMYLGDGTCVGITQLIFYSYNGSGNFHASLSSVSVRKWLKSVGYDHLLEP
jgi:S1-C subfamily serine protease